MPSHDTQRPKQLAPFTNVPTLIFRPPFPQSSAKFEGGDAVPQIFRAEDDRKMLPKRFLFAIAQDFFGFPVPACDMALGIKREDRVVPNILHRRRETSLQFMRLDLFAIESVSRVRLRTSCTPFPQCTASLVPPPLQALETRLKTCFGTPACPLPHLAPPGSCRSVLAFGSIPRHPANRGKSTRRAATAGFELPPEPKVTGSNPAGRIHKCSAGGCVISVKRRLYRLFSQ